MIAACVRRILPLVAPLSIAGGIVSHGVYFLARQAYGFTDRQNLLLAVAVFLPYVPAALLAGPVGRRLGYRRAILALNALSALVGIVLATTPPAWALWLLAPLYNGAAGMFWPLVEGYVAGGRQGRDLHRTIGAFNLTWSAALAPAMWIVGALGDSLLETFGVLVALHVAVGLAALRLAPAPPGHVEEHRAPAPPSYAGMLRACRVLLPLSYMVLDALAPLLPTVWSRAGVNAAAGAALSSTWMIARFFAFLGLFFWSGWRGRGTFLVAGTAALLAGFALVLGLPSLGAALIGLAVFGVGQGALYYAALYYAMAAEGDAVESGGTHEAVIGVGYLAGPLLALAGTAVGVAPVHVVGATATAGALWAWRRARA